MQKPPENLPKPNEPTMYPYPPRDLDDEINLLELWQVLMRRKWLIILVTLFAGVMATLAAFLMTPVYRAEVLLAPVEEESQTRFAQYAGLASLAGIDLGSGGKSSKGAIAIASLQSRAFITPFIEDEQLMPILFAESWDSQKQRWILKEEEEAPTLLAAYEMFSDILNVTEEKTGLVELAIEWTDPEQAAAWANKLVTRLNGSLKEKDIGQAQHSIEYLNKELAKTSIVEVQQAIHRLIESQIKTIMMANVTQDHVFRVIDPAVVPETHIKPKRELIVLLGAVAGFMFAVFLVFFMRFLETQKGITKQNNSDIKQDSLPASE